MKRIKHSKVKNTGIVFELLVRQVASDTMNNRNSKALHIIKKHFNSDSELSKELKLYRTISQETFVNESHASQFLNAVINTRQSLNDSILRRNKYNLIKELKSTYNLDEFFKSRIINYKVHASTYKIFEYAQADDPAEYMASKFALVEHIQTSPVKKEETPKLASQHKDVRLLASKLVVDKFNAKYSSLNEEQKRMLREYINNVTNSIKLKKYVLSETIKIKTALSSLRSSIANKVIRIKLTEVANLLNKMNKQHSIQDKDVLTMLRYYELVNELKNVGAK
tara:strand:+ start:1000 stop:1842 length:843 start_codon:yes stop_codon:yes gene_type:complete